MDKNLNVLEEANALTAGDRQQAYGDPADVYGPVADMWQAYLDALDVDNCLMLTPKDVMLMMALLKIGREGSREKRDNLVDAAGYLRCVEMIDESGKMLSVRDLLSEGPA